MRVAVRIVALLFLLFALGCASAQARVVLSEGHVDAVSPRYENGQLILKTKDDTGENGPVVREPTDVLFHAKPESKLTVPDGIPPSYYPVIGQPGEDVWILPMTQDPVLLWPGFSSETINDGVFDSNQLTWKLKDCRGPGHFSLYTEGPFGEPAEVPFNTRKDNSVPADHTVRTRTHAHYSWAFSAPGTYKFSFEVTGTPVGGTPLSTGTRDFTFFVGDLADAPAEGAPAPTRRCDGKVDSTPDPGTQPTTPSESGSPVGPQGITPAALPKPTALSARVARASIKGRTLAQRLRTTLAGSARVTLFKGKRAVADSRGRKVTPGVRTVRWRLSRALKPGAYRLRTRVRSGARVVVKWSAVRVR